MYLTYRPAQPKDLKEAFPLIFDRAVYSKKEQRHLLAFWNFLITKKIARSVIIEDRESPPGQKIKVVALSVFVTDAFAQEARTTLSPPLSHHVFQRWMKGKRVFLNSKEIALHNSKRDLNLMPIHHGWPILSNEAMGQLQAKLLEAFFVFHAGYGIKQYFFDSYGETDKTIMLNQGFHLLRDHGQTLPFRDNPNIPLSMFLVGADRGIIGPKDSLPIFSLLNAPSPRFGFSMGEKDVLEKAFLGETDQEIARSLRLSIWAIKKRWQGIYGKVEGTDANLLAPAGLSGSSDETQKIERRRFLLDYLRNHLEEIRPTLPLKRRKTLKFS